MILALLFLGAYALPILDTGLSTEMTELANSTQWVVWAVFAVDYFVRLRLAVDRRYFVRHNLLDLAAVILPMLRPLRLLRLVGTAMLITQRSQVSTRYKVTTYVVGTSVLVVLLAGLAVLDAESGQPGANISSPGEAFWWSVVTVTTVGYGDFYPVTATGRIVAVLLMATGIALLGVITANVAAWFVERFNETGEQAQREQDRLDQILAELRALRAERRLEHSKE
jgi:voltage-gated potassium channel